MAFSLMNKHKFEIDTNPSGTSSYATIAVGVKNVQPKNNEKLVQDEYFDGNGYGTTDIVGAQLTLAFTADRDFNDQAQNFIIGTLLNLGTSRRTNFRWTLPDGSVFTGVCTIANIEGPSGDAGAKGEVKFEIHFNGKPTLATGTSDTTPPTVSSTTPAANATGVADASTFAWTFSEAINPATVTSDNFFLIKQTDGSNIAGTLSINVANTTVTFTPTGSFPAATVILAIVTNGVTDLNGNKLANNQSTKFTTV